MMFHGIGMFSPFFAFGGALTLLVLAAILWSLVLKGFALWYSARAEQKGWFVALLVVNTFGILEIIYLIWFRPKSSDLVKNAPAAPSSSAPAA